VHSGFGSAAGLLYGWLRNNLCAPRDLEGPVDTGCVKVQEGLRQFSLNLQIMGDGAGWMNKQESPCGQFGYSLSEFISS